MNSNHTGVGRLNMRRLIDALRWLWRAMLDLVYPPD